MKIKKVHKTIKKNKKTVASIALLGLSLILTSCSTKETESLKTLTPEERIEVLEKENKDLQKENKKLQKEYDNLVKGLSIEEIEDCYYKYALMAVVTNDQDGTPEYHFVVDDKVDFDYDNKMVAIDVKAYASITNPKLVYPHKKYNYLCYSGPNIYLYDTIPNPLRLARCPIYGGWIPDYNLEYIVLKDINNLPLPEKYKEQSSFSVEELRDIENQMNNHLIDATEQVKQNAFNKEDLFYVLTDENTGFIIDGGKCLRICETTDAINLDKLEYKFYYYSIINPMRGIKKSLGMSARDADIQEKTPNNIYEVVSLDPNDEMLLPVQAVKSIEYFINFETIEKYQDKETLTYDEILEMEEEINKAFAEKNVKILKKYELSQ